MSAWRENIERVREALNTAHPISGDDHDAVDASDAALDALTAQIEELERERDEAKAAAFEWKKRNYEKEDEITERWMLFQARAEAAEQRVKELGAALQVLYDWSSRMPDAGFTAVSPRYLWWFERPVAQVRAALAQSDPPED